MEIMHKLKGYLIAVIIFIPPLLDVWADGVNFTIGVFAFFFLVIPIYGCFKLRTSYISINKNNWLKGGFGLIVLLGISAWGVWRFLSNPFEIVQADGGDVYSGIVGLLFLGPFIFLTYTSLLISKVCMQKNITNH